MMPDEFARQSSALLTEAAAGLPEPRIAEHNHAAHDAVNRWVDGCPECLVEILEEGYTGYDDPELDTDEPVIPIPGCALCAADQCEDRAAERYAK